MILGRRTSAPGTRGRSRGDLAGDPTWNAISAVATGQVFSWNSEPVYSHLGAAGILEGIAQGVADARPVTG